MSILERSRIARPSQSQATLQWDELAYESGESWSQLVEQIVQLEELIADLREDRDAESVSLAAMRKLHAMLQEKRRRLRAIDVAG